MKKNNITKEKVLNGFKMKPINTSLYNSTLKVPLASFIISLPILFLAQNALAISLGAAKVESNIGQKLQVFIPIDSIDNGKENNFNSLKAEVLNSDQENSQAPLLSVFKDFDRKGLLISSENIVNDVFINFSIKTNLDGNQRLYEFTTLLDPSSQESTKLDAKEILASNEVAPNNQKINSLMGPTETLTVGSVPKERFGPVLDGQSLVRVARRINKAYNISVEKMMWNLFKANSKSFLTDSIDSLAAGSILNIPRKHELIDLPSNGISNSRTLNTADIKKDIATSKETVLNEEIIGDLAIENVNQNEAATPSLESNEALTLKQLSSIQVIKSNLKDINNRLEYLHNRQLEQNERLNNVETINKNAAIASSSKETASTAEIIPAVTSTIEESSSTDKSLVSTTSNNSSSKLILTSILSLLSGILIGIGIALRGQHWLKVLSLKAATIKSKLEERFTGSDTEDDWQEEVVTPTPDYSNLKPKKNESKKVEKSKAVPRPRIGMELSTEKELDWVPQPNFKFSKVNKEKRRERKQLKDELRIQESLKALKDNAMDDMVLEKYKIGNDIAPDTKSYSETEESIKIETETDSYHSFLSVNNDENEKSIELKSEVDGDSYLPINNEGSEKSIDIHLDDLSITLSEVVTNEKEDLESYIVLESPQLTQVSIVSDETEEKTAELSEVDFNDEKTTDDENSIEFDEHFTVVNENTITFEEAQLIDLIISLSNNKEFETAHSILDGCGESSEHIDYCRLHILSNEKKNKDFLELYTHIEKNFADMDEKLVKDVKDLKKALEESGENDVIEFTQKKRAQR